MGGRPSGENSLVGDSCQVDGTCCQDVVGSAGENQPSAFSDTGRAVGAGEPD